MKHPLQIKKQQQKQQQQQIQQQNNNLWQTIWTTFILMFIFVYLLFGKSCVADDMDERHAEHILDNVGKPERMTVIERMQDNLPAVTVNDAFDIILYGLGAIIVMFIFSLMFSMIEKNK